MRTNLPSEIIQLIAGHLRETNSPEQEKKFAEWLAVSGNDAEYNKYLKIWKEIAEASADSFDTERAWSELNRRLAEERRRNFFSSRIVRVSAGIAAAAAVAFVSIFSYDIMSPPAVRLWSLQAFRERAVSAFLTVATSHSTQVRPSHTKNHSARRLETSRRTAACSSMFSKTRENHSS